MTREKKMKPFEVLQALFLHDLAELQRLEKRGWFVLPMIRVVKEEHLGRCCYLAEEFLSPAELCVLKQQLGLDERRWLAYKTRISGQ
jgi:hypothetical protein